MLNVCLSPVKSSKGLHVATGAIYSSAPLNLSARGFRVLGIDRLGVRDGFKIVAYFTFFSIITLAVLRKKE